MSKPIILQQVGPKWEVFIDVAAARRFGVRTPRVKKWIEEGLGDATIPIAKSGQRKVEPVPGGRPYKFSKSDAESLAHTIGSILFNLGDFVYTYTEERREQKEPNRDIIRGERARSHRRARVRSRRSSR